MGSRKVYDINTQQWAVEAMDYSTIKSGLESTGISVNLNFPEASYTGYRINPYAGKLSKSYSKSNDEKKVPDNLHALLSDRERVGAVLYVIERHTPSNTWHIKYKTNKFFLTGLSMGLKEKVQIMETFGSAVVSFFGNSVKIYEFSGVTVEAPSVKSMNETNFAKSAKAGSYVNTAVAGIDEQQDNPNEQTISSSNSSAAFWQSSLIHMYEHVLRGTQLVKNNSVALLTVGTHYIYGYPLNLMSVYNAQADKMATFTMSWIVLDHVMAYDDIEPNDFAKNYAPVETTEDVGSNTIDSPIMQDYSSLIKITNSNLG
ncbi:MAG TPA: hypothetical protein PKN48_00455 [Bacteroidales bacterium]|mgnify:CR=1 FL=1|nr:hypothetical protein [Bacteroidales bacterium]